MCTSYKLGDIKIFEAFSEFPAAGFDFEPKIFKHYGAPIFRRSADGVSTDLATFALVKRIPKHVKKFDTMNARAETLVERRNLAAHGKDYSYA